MRDPSGRGVGADWAEVQGTTQGHGATTETHGWWMGEKVVEGHRSSWICFPVGKGGVRR